MINIKGIDKRVLLAALVNNGRPMGMGVLHHRHVTPEDVAPYLNGGSIDYCFGVPIKMKIEGDEFDEWGYDRDQGEGSAERVINSIRS